ncbi:MAG TPA: MG2 domain-containing protein [Armatimonadota bacterium]|jgi:hypothetical protein
MRALSSRRQGGFIAVLARLLAPGQALSLLVGLGLCIALLAQGVTEEVPLGAVRGTVVMAENGRPLPGATLYLRPKVKEGQQEDPTLDPAYRPRTRMLKSDAEGRFHLSRLLAGTYTLEASAKAHSLEEKTIQVAEGEPQPLTLTMKPQDPYLDLYENQHTYLPREAPALEVHGFEPHSEIALELRRVAFADLIAGGGLRSTLSPFANSRDAKGRQALSRATLIRRTTQAVANRDAEGTFIEKVTLPPLSEGIYWLDCTCGTLTKGTYMLVSRIALVTKHAGQNCVAYATDLETGRALSGATVGLLSQSAMHPLGSTDATGLLKITLPAPQPGHDGVSLVASQGESHAIVDGLGSSNEDSPGYRLYTYTDRPVYRPGDQVRFKGVLRQVTGSDLRVPPQVQGTVEVRDGSDSVVLRVPVTTSPMGTFNGEFPLLKEAAAGGYSLVCQLGKAEGRGSFTVAAYRKPEMQVKVAPAKPFFIRGEQGQASVQCTYYFGGPVAGAEVTAYISRQPYWMPIPGVDADEMDMGGFYGGGGGESVAEVKGTTDAEGKLALSFDTKPGTSPDQAPARDEPDTDYQYTIYASVQEPGGKFADATGTALVARGDFALAVEPDRYVASPGDSLQATVRSADHGSQAPRRGVPLKVVVGHETWNGNEVVFTPESTLSVRTGADGKATVPFRVSKEGSTLLVCTSQDGRGNTIEARAYVYSEGAGLTPAAGKAPTLEVALDRHKYNQGDTVTALIRTNRPGGSALVSLEGTQLRDARVVELSSAATSVRLPVTRELAPNAFVAVAYVRDKTFLEASRRLSVGLGERVLNLRIESDKATYHPRETATYTIHAAKPDGSPAAAELCLGVVDEAIYAIQEDSTNLVEGLYPKRYNAVQTLYSFPELYLDGGDKGSMDPNLRRDFRDTAYWNAVIQTDATGTATVQVPLPDNLTQWRATVTAVTADGAVGQATHQLRVAKELMVRLQPPTFLVEGDQQRVSAIVMKQEGPEEDVRVNLKTDGVVFRQAAEQTVRVRPGSPATVSWDVEASRSGSALLRAMATGSQSHLADGMEVRVPVRPHGREARTLRAGTVRDTEVLHLSLDRAASTSEGRLLVTLTPTLASAMLESLDSLVDYPYGCVEQTMSRFLPTVVLAKALQEMNLPRPSRMDQAPELVREGFARLKKMQHGDGGWGWWEYDETDPFMTAWVLEGLQRAEQAGYTPDPFVMSRAILWSSRYVKGEIEDAPKDTARKKDRTFNRIYLAFALALNGKSGAAAPYLSSLSLTALDADELSAAVLALSALGDAYRGPRDQAAQLLEDRAVKSEGLAHWQGRFWGVETTARAFTALTTVNPANPILPSVVRYLMLQRRGDSWMSTRDTCTSLIGLTGYLRQTGELSASYDLSVRLNGQEVKRLSFGPGTAETLDTRVELPLTSLRRGDNRLELARVAGATGQPPAGGLCYYTADLRQVITQAALPAVTGPSGLSISRAYYRLSTRRLEDGTLRLLPEKEALTSLRRGELVRCVLTLRTNTPQEYLMLEDSFPSNCRVMDRGQLDPDETWSWWWSSSEVRDDRMVFFARSLEKGTHTIDYTLRAETPGTSKVLPSTLSVMYDPGITAASPGTQMEVRE